LLELCAQSAGQVDLVTGGPPCQGFSIQRIGDDHDGRNSLVIHFAELVAGIQPKCVVMENVPGIIGKRGRAFLTKAVSILELAGYRVKDSVLNAADYGVPQIRKRFFLIGLRTDLGMDVSFPQPTHSTCWKTVRDAFDGLASPPPKEEAVDLLHYRTKMSELNAKRIAMISPGEGFESLPTEMRVRCHRNGAAAIGHRNVYGRMELDAPGSTITARFDSFTRGKFGHPVEPRNITLREGARLQTFEDDFQFAGNQEETAAQIGNAVPPLLAEALGRHVIDLMKGSVPEYHLQLNDISA
jgi:DNA (cytosine-5)-methyltransferase 1